MENVKKFQKRMDTIKKVTVGTIVGCCFAVAGLNIGVAVYQKAMIRHDQHDVLSNHAYLLADHQYKMEKLEEYVYNMNKGTMTEEELEKLGKEADEGLDPDEFVRNSEFISEEEKAKYFDTEKGINKDVILQGSLIGLAAVTCAVEMFSACAINSAKKKEVLEAMQNQSEITK